MPEKEWEKKERERVELFYKENHGDYYKKHGHYKGYHWDQFVWILKRLGWYMIPIVTLASIYLLATFVPSSDPTLLVFILFLINGSWFLIDINSDR